MRLQSYKGFAAWRKARELVREVDRHTEGLPSSEVQPTSPCSGFDSSNIAEGQGRLTVGEFKQFIGHAEGSVLELETQVLDRVQEVGRILSDFLTSLGHGRTSN